MKRKIFRSLLFICSFTCLMAVFMFGVSAKDVTSGDFVFSVNGTTATVKEYKGTAKAVKIPSKVGKATVKRIGNEAFWSVKTMTSITIPSTVTSIGKAAFNECTGLTKVVIPKNVTKIGASAFWYCTNLKSVVIPKSVTSIGKNAFKGCNKLTAYVIKGSYAENHIKTLSNVTLGYRYISSLKLNKTTLTIQVKDTFRLTPAITPKVVYNKKVKYTSSNKKVATVSSNGTITAVAPGTATITCKAKDGSGKKKTCKVTVTPQKVTNLRQTNTTATGYTLRWNKSEGATKYRIYRYNESTKKWDTIKYTTKNYYKVTDRAVGSANKYRIRAFTQINKTYYRASFSAVFNARTLYPKAVTSINTAAGNNYVTLSWSKAANATGYRIFFHDPAKKTNTFIAQTTATSFKVTSLKPNTEYSFVIRAYMTANKKTVYSDFSPAASCTTLPDYVSGLRVKENSVFVSKFTLQWNALSGVSGYRLLRYDSASKAYVPLATIDGASSTEYTVDGLQPGTSYSFKIQAFVEKGDTIIYGFNSTSPLTVTTNSRPANNEEAFKGFIEAYNNSKNNTKDFTLITSTSVSDFAGEGSEQYAKVLSSVAENGSSFLNFKAGIESTSKLPVTSVLAPKDAFSTLAFEQLSPDSVSFYDDGNGFRISFTLPEDDGTVNALITDTIDWEKVSSQNEGFTLNKCTYEGTTVNAKVHNGMIDDITVSIPVTVSFSMGESSYEFSETITEEYLFIW
ncbi:MAG: leucine-rich repeat protein [Clostridia bacterium]|nr:leucine-rich repeat protein [Clostridia bacterium]